MRGTVGSRHLLPGDQQDAAFLAVLNLAVDVVEYQQLAPAVLQQCHLVGHLEGRGADLTSSQALPGTFPSPIPLPISIRRLTWVWDLGKPLT